MSSRSTKIVVGVCVGVFAVACAALVAWGIRHHEEAGMMRACVAYFGEYDYTGDCEEVRLKGNRPFIVDFARNPDPAMPYDEILDDAIKRINNRVGGALLKAGNLKDELCDIDAEICYRPEQAYEQGWREGYGDASHQVLSIEGKMLVLCDIHTRNTGIEQLEFYSLMHELLHCLGLDDDDPNLEKSIMRKAQQRTMDPRSEPWITDGDRKLLRKTYNIQ